MSERLDYVGIDEHGVYAVHLIDHPYPNRTEKQLKEWRRDVAKFCAEIIKEGGRLEKMPAEDAARGLRERRDKLQAIKKANAEPTLFSEA